jgi:hypothetical protein
MKIIIRKQNKMSLEINFYVTEGEKMISYQYKECFFIKKMQSIILIMINVII